MTTFREHRLVTVLVLPLLTAPSVAADQDAATAEAPAFDLIEADLASIQAAFDAGALSAEILTQSYLDRVDRLDAAGPRLNTMISINPVATERARELDAERAETGSRGLLHGVPIVVKDSINAVGLETTGGSAALRGHEPFTDAAVVRRLREVGAILLGKSNLSEMQLGYGRNGYSSAGGQTRNPYNLRRDPFNCAAAAAVAANLAMLGVGSDTVGALRGSASANALVGIRPTLGLTSRAGVIPTALSLDVTGPLARSVRDASLMLGIMAGVDDADPRTAESAPYQVGGYTETLNDGALDGARIGILVQYRGGNREVDTAFQQAVATLTTQGAVTIDVELPDDLLAGWRDLLDLVVETELRDQLNAYLANTEEGMPHSLADLLRMSESPLLAGSEHPVHSGRIGGYRNALRSPGLANLAYLYIVSNRMPASRDALIAVMDSSDLDALAMPTLLCPAASLLDEYDGSYECDADDPTRPTELASMTGFPEITLPMGFSKQGLPLGLSLLGRPYSEPRLIALAYAFEQATDQRRPPEFAAPALPDLDRLLDDAFDHAH
ncbi:MAG: amidase family protein [Thiohalocapsa sp.]